MEVDGDKKKRFYSFNCLHQPNNDSNKYNFINIRKRITVIENHMGNNRKIHHPKRIRGQIKRSVLPANRKLILLILLIG